jgi:hypothetical protein
MNRAQYDVTLGGKAYLLLTNGQHGPPELHTSQSLLFTTFSLTYSVLRFFNQS